MRIAGSSLRINMDLVRVVIWWEFCSTGIAIDVEAFGEC